VQARKKKEERRKRTTKQQTQGLVGVRAVASRGVLIGHRHSHRCPSSSVSVRLAMSADYRAQIAQVAMVHTAGEPNLSRKQLEPGLSSSVEFRVVS
jgi:hypothetical protein